jgi:hypothetical protein
MVVLLSRLLLSGTREEVAAYGTNDFVGGSVHWLCHRHVNARCSSFPRRSAA